MSAIYLIQAGPDGPINVGIVGARGLKNRLEALQRGNHQPLTTIRVIEGDNHLERRLHVELAEHRILGDWYQPAILNQLATVLGAQHAEALAAAEADATLDALDALPAT